MKLLKVNQIGKSKQDIHHITLDKANIIYSDYKTSNNDINRLQSFIVDDTNMNLQVFFHYLERLLQIDMKSIKEKNHLNTLFGMNTFRSKIIPE